MNGINNAGTIAGDYTDVNQQLHGFVANPSTGYFLSVDYPGGGSTFLYAINNNGTSVGRSGTNSFTVDSSGNIHPMPVITGYNIILVFGINDSGDISAILAPSDNSATFYAVIHPDGSFVNYGATQSVAASPGSLNNSLQMVQNTNQGSIIVNADGSIIQLQPPSPATSASGAGLNNLGTFGGRADTYGLTRDSSGNYGDVFCPGISGSNGEYAFNAINDNGVLASTMVIATPLPGLSQTTVDPPSLTFATTAEGQTSQLTVTVTNTGNALLDIGALNIVEPANGGPVFNVSGCLDSTRTASLDPGASCTLTVTASPRFSGTFNGTLYIEDSSPGSPHPVPLQVSTSSTPPTCSTSITPYLQVNGGAWQQTATASVATGSTVNLGPQPSVWGGSWSWSGPGGFTSNQREIDGIPLTAGSNTFVASYLDPSGCTSTESFVITVGSGSGAASFTLSSSSPNLTVPVGGSSTDTISITPSGGFTGSVSLSASGLPTGVTASFGTNPATTSSVLTLAAANSTAAGTYNVTVSGVSNSLTASTQISLTVGGSGCSTTLIPYLQVNGGAWQETATASVATGSTVNLGPQPSVWGGSWSWSGPGGFTSNQREVDGIPLSGGTNTFVASYVDPSGCTSTETFVITAPGGSASFTLSSSSPNLTVPVGGSGTDNIFITPSGGFNGSVTLSASGLPTGVTASFGTNPATTSSVLTLAAANSAVAGTYNLNVTGVSNSLTASTQITLTIGTSGCGTTLSPYLQINGAAWQQIASASVAAGATVNLGPQPSVWGGSWSWSGPGGFASDQREIDGIPLSAGSNTFVASYVDPGGCTSTLAYVITVGSGGSPSFTLSSSAPNLTVPVGSSGTDTISITPSGGFTGGVTLSASGLPTGVTASFGTNPATTSSVLTVTAANSAAGGTYSVTVTGVSASLSASTQISLTIGNSGCTPTALTPYMQVNGGAWQQTANASVAAGSTVNLGPQPAVWGGGWSWSGPGGFTSNQREIDGIPLSAGSNTFVATYVDPNSCSSNLTFVITE